MNLIADSGSTKTAWCITKGNECVQQLFTSGINPFYMEAPQIQDELRVLSSQIDGKINHIYFYGSGVVSISMSDFLCQCFQKVFPETTAEVYTDLLGAARALCQHEPGIVGILGTGSNSCFYDGTTIADTVPPCGFILGDEGSGAALGKRLVADYLKRRLPADLHQAFTDYYQLSKDDILEQVYRKIFPNRFLASFAKFLHEQQAHSYIHELLTTSFGQFFTYNIIHYDYTRYPLHLLGSVAFYFKENITATAAQHQITIGKVEKNALQGLICYHNNN
ncbi:MAG: ATPase [Prevotellaceae bacterium]|jgi:N-acetylglucosamine kinase-like BadF-type ATPase|nr:ATPase [Prevotellaceae bacterium]